MGNSNHGQPRWLAALRVIVVIHALAVLAQAVFAGQFLSGVDHLVVFHEATGWSVLVVCLIQIVVSIPLLRTGAAALGFILGTVGLLLCEALQVGTGYGRFLGVHIPLGMLIFGGVMWQLVWILREQPLPLEQPQ